MNAPDRPPTPRRATPVWACCRSLALLPLLCGAAGCRPPEPALPRPTDLPPPAHFPAEAASNALRRVASLIALGPRDAGTPGAETAAAWIAAQLQADGLKPRIDRFVDATPDGPQTFHNVLAEWIGASSGTVVLLSHFDTRSGLGPDYVGANDGGSSTALLLELAAHLARRGQPRLTLLFAFLDGEECRQAYGPRDGLHGSRRLAAQLQAAGREVRAVILLDMVGDRDLGLTLPRNSTPALKLLLFDAALAQGCRDRIELLPCDILDDHQPFLDRGYPAIDLIDFHYGRGPRDNRYWHTPDDTLDKLSAESLQGVGSLVLEMLQRQSP